MYAQQALLSALELIRFEVLTDKPYSKTYARIAGDGNVKIIQFCEREIIGALTETDADRDGAEAHPTDYSYLVIATDGTKGK